MIVCENCFKDIQIKEIIAKERSCQIEECPSCGQKGGRFIDVGRILKIYLLFILQTHFWRNNILMKKKDSL